MLSITLTGNSCDLTSFCFGRYVCSIRCIRAATRRGAGRLPRAASRTRSEGRGHDRLSSLGWSIKKFVQTARRYRTVQIRAGSHILTAEDPLPDDLRDALALIL